MFDSLNAWAEQFIERKFDQAENMLRYGTVDPTGGRGKYPIPLSLWNKGWR